MASEHAAPQAPQCVGVVPRLVSQPLAATRSQSPKPARQAATVHAPAEQPAVALASEHALPQAPQFDTLVLVAVSHPLATDPSQSPKPVEHAMRHPPAAQLGEPLTLLHTLPHAPQWAALVLRLVSQPSALTPLQSPKPGEHAMVQRPLLQSAEPLALPQTTPQAPQLPTLPRLASQPLAALPSQLPKPVLQLATVHAPPAHPAVALGSEHAAPQRPQLEGVVLVLVSHPLATLPSQLPYAALQVMPHAPAEQLAAPLVALHAAPQRPQWPTLVPRAVSHPLAAMPSQSPKPARQA